MKSFSWTEPFHRFLHTLPPETAHQIVTRLVKAYQSFLPKAPPIKTEEALIFADYSKLKFRNRLGLAAGFDKNAEMFPGLATFGFGFVEVGTVTPLAQSGNPKPRIFRVKKNCLVNHLGFNNCGIEQFRRNLLKLRPYCPVPVLVNIGKGRETPLEKAGEDYELGFSHLRDVADGFVVNVSSPNTPGLFSLQTREFFSSMEKYLPVNLPTWVKLSPDLSLEQISEISVLINESRGFAGLILTNTSRQMAQEHNFAEGGFSGPPLLSRSLAAVSTARAILKPSKILIGVGGISSAEDAEKMRNAGADLIEVYTSFVYQGPRLIAQVSQSLK